MQAKPSLQEIAMIKLIMTATMVCSTAVLIACGGGGGGGNVWFDTSVGAFETPTLAASYSYSALPGFTLAVRYLYPIDVDGDGVDELLVAGFETQPNTPSNYKNTKISLLGWRGGQFANLTSQWLPNLADQVEGVGDIAVGDFNHDGRLDIFLSAYADMNFNVNAYQLINKGGYFEKSVVENVVGWQHGVAAADINHDGYTDVFSVGYGDAPRVYLGGPTGLVPKRLASYAGGSGIAMADFLNDGSTTAFIVDYGPDRVNNSVLMRFIDDGAGNITDVARVSTPPGPLLGDIGHNVRAKAFDFNADGLMDVLVFTRETWNGTQWPVNSRIQFLKNNGGGQFTDVTTDLLVGYATNSNASYSPVFIDLNGDRLTDVFLSESQYGASNSTAMLIQVGNGKFVDTGRSQLSANLSANGGMATVLRGPGGIRYFAFESQSYGGSATLSLSKFVPH
jgi:FG-GAP-like repeat